MRWLLPASLILVTCATPTGVRRIPIATDPVLPAANAEETTPGIASPHLPRAQETRLRERMARAHERMGRSRPASTSLVWGQLGTGQTQAFNATLTQGVCYTVIAAAATADQELDLVLYDHDGEEVERVRSTEWAVALELCPPEQSLYRIVVRMYSGSGSFALQVFGS